MDTRENTNAGDRRTARVIKNAARVRDVPVLVGSCEGSGSSDGRPVAKLILEKDGKTLIEVLCSCGKKIVLECEYD